MIASLKKASTWALIVSVMALGFVIAPRIARAAPCSIPFTFTNGTPANANQVNADFQAVVTCIASAVVTIAAGPSGNIVIAGTTSNPTVDLVASPIVSGSILAGGGIAAGYTSAPSGPAGDLFALESSGCGGLNLATGSAGRLDYGCATAGRFTFTGGGVSASAFAAAAFNDSSLTPSATVCSDGSSNLTSCTIGTIGTRYTGVFTLSSSCAPGAVCVGNMSGMPSGAAGICVAMSSHTNVGYIGGLAFSVEKNGNTGSYYVNAVNGNQSGSTLNNGTSVQLNVICL